MEKEKQKIIDVTSFLATSRQQLEEQESNLLKKAKNQGNQKVHELNLAFDREQQEWEARSREKMAAYEQQFQQQVEQEMLVLTRRYEERKEAAFQQFVEEIFDYGDR